MNTQSLKSSLFGAIMQIFRPPPRRAQPMPDNGPQRAATQRLHQPQLNQDSDEDGLDDSLREEDDPYIPLKPARRKEIRLMDFIPDVGYFLAGGLSGITSRTMTAPLDRLKVYLIAQTGNSNAAIDAAKSGDALAATHHGARTLANACRELWAAGGIRSLFAGRFKHRCWYCC